MSLSPRYNRIDLEAMRGRLDRLLSEVGGKTWELLDRGIPVDVIESDQEIVVKAAVPGVAADNLEIHYTDRVLTIRAETRASQEESGDTWHMREIRSGHAERSVTLPRTVDTENATAALEDGVLQIRLPIAKEAARRRIEIKPSS